MGTAPPSKPLKEPARPFKREQRRACLQHTFLPKARKDPTVLLHLISRREWQKVLIRVTLFPGEVTQRQKMTWYGVQWSLIPLHLACALQPPSEVISMLLRFHSDTARVRMNRSSPPPNKKKKRWHGVRRNKKKLATIEENNYALVKSNQGQGVPKIDTAPSSSSDDGEQNEEHHSEKETQEAPNHASSDCSSLLDDDAFTMEGELSRLHVFETYDDDESTDSEGSPIAVPPEKLPDYEEAPAPHSALHDSANNRATKDHVGKRDVALQLNTDGSLQSITVESNNVVPSKMNWSLDPLLMEADALMPLHIACLFRASPTVIASLLEAYPKAAQDSALGMLPIHMVCAGFDLPAPVLAPPPGPVRFPHDDEFNMAESIRRLETAFPEGLVCPSESNGMTPRMYIDETLDDGPYKDSCLEALGVVPDESIEKVEQEDEEDEVAETKVSYHDDSTLTTRVPDEVHCDDDSSTLPSFQTETSSRYLGQDLPQINGFSGSPLYTQMVTKDWEKALATIEEHPEEGHQWQYGIELDRIETLDSAIMWKRLPIHSACVLHAPIGLIEALIWAYPKGIRTTDPFTGSLPLHLACRHSAPPELVKTIIMAYPTGSRIADMVGRLPLHMACLSGASRLTFIYLLKAYPHAVLIKDDRRRTPLQYANQNPTLKSETVELLQLVHHFLEKQPAVEDDYIFEGFSTPRSVASADDSSAVSGFYEDSFSRHSPNTQERLENSPSSGSQPLLKDVSADRLAEEFSQILDNDEEEEDDDDIAGRVTPKFGVSRSKREREETAEFSPMLKEDEVDDRVTPSFDESSAEKEQEDERAAPTMEHQNVEVSEASAKAEGATLTLAKLVFLGNKREKEHSPSKYSIKAGVLTKELSRIMEEDSSVADEEASSEKSTESNVSTLMNENEGGQSRSVSDAEEPTEENSQDGITETSESSAKEESPLDRLSKLGVLMAKNEDGQNLASSTICLDGDRQSSSGEYDQCNSTESPDSSNPEVTEVEETEKSDLADKPTPDDSPVDTPGTPASKEELSSEGDTKDVEDIEVQTRTVAAAEVERHESHIEEDEDDDDDSESQESSTASKGAIRVGDIEEASPETNDDPVDMGTDSSSEKDDSTAVNDEEPKDNATEAVLLECHNERPVTEDSANKCTADNHLSSNEKDDSTAASDEEPKDNTTEAVLRKCHNEQPANEDATNECAADTHLSSSEKDDSTAANDEEPKDNATEAVLRECHNEQPVNEDATSLSFKEESTKEDDEPPMMGFAPADVAAGCCSPPTVPLNGSPSRSFNTAKPYERSNGNVKATAVEPAGILDSDSIPYEPLVDETEVAETVGTLVDHLTKKDEPQAWTSYNQLTSFRSVSSTDGTVIASNCVQQDQKDAAPKEAPETAGVVAPSEREAGEPEKPPSEDPAEFQFDNKSDDSTPTGNSINAESSASIQPESPKPDVTQERDDQNKTNSPKQEERLDHSCVLEAHV